MVFKEVCQDLFSVPEDYCLAHCISADFALGAGIAVQFCKRFDTKQKLKTLYPDYMDKWDNALDEYGMNGDCILVDNVLNLITKRNYWHKPTYRSMRMALNRMKSVVLERSIKKIAMPRIGCGLDGLGWYAVSALILDTFKDVDIEILVCYQ